MGEEAVETGEVVEEPQKSSSSHKSSRSSRSSRSSKSKSGSSRSSKRSSKSSSKSGGSSSSSKSGSASKSSSSRSHRSSKGSSSKSSRHKSSSNGKSSSSSSRSSKDKDVVVLEDDDDEAEAGRTVHDAIPLEDDDEEEAVDSAVSSIRAKLKKKGSSSSSSSKSKSRSSRSSKHSSNGVSSSSSSRSSRHRTTEENGSSSMDIDMMDEAGEQPPAEMSAEEAEEARRFAEKMAALEAKAAAKEAAAAEEAGGAPAAKAPIKMQVNNTGNESSASIEETNRVRIAMGLPPLNLGPSKEDLERQRHEARQLEIQNERLLEEARQRVERLRRERQHKKATAGLSIAEMLAGDASASDALSWVTKQRESKSSVDQKKEDRRVKALEEMFADEEDDDFGPIVPDNKGGISAEGGVRIAHNASDFKAGEDQILVLEDQTILDKKGDFIEGDALQSIGISEKEKLERNKRRKAGRREYDPYGDQNSILSHYDEEDPKKRGLLLGDDGVSIGGAGTNNTVVPKVDDMSEEAIRLRLESQAAVNINADLRLQSETFTAEEWSAINLGLNRKKKKKKKKDKKSKKKSKKRSKTPHNAPADFASWPIELQEEWLEDEKKRLATSLVDEIKSGGGDGDNAETNGDSTSRRKSRGGHLKEESERMNREKAEREARYSKAFELSHKKSERLKDDFFDKKRAKGEDADGDADMEAREVDPLISLKASEEAARRQAALTRQAERSLLTSAFADFDEEEDEREAAMLEMQRKAALKKTESLSEKIRKAQAADAVASANAASQAAANPAADNKYVISEAANFVTGLGNDNDDQDDDEDEEMDDAQLKAAVAGLETGEDAPIVEDVYGIKPINQEHSDGEDSEDEDEDVAMEDEPKPSGESGAGWVKQNPDGSMVPIQKLKKKKKVPKKKKSDDGEKDGDDDRTGDFLDREPLASGGMAEILKLVKRRGLLKDEKEFTGRANDERPGWHDRMMTDDPASNINLEKRDPLTGKVLTRKEAFRQLSHKFHGRMPSKSKQEKAMKEEEQAKRKKLNMMNIGAQTSALSKLKEVTRETGQAHVVLDGKKSSASLLGGGHFSDSLQGHATVPIEKQPKRKGNFSGKQGGGKKFKK